MLFFCAALYTEIFGFRGLDLVAREIGEECEIVAFQWGSWTTRGRCAAEVAGTSDLEACAVKVPKTHSPIPFTYTLAHRVTDDGGELDTLLSHALPQRSRLL